MVVVGVVSGGVSFSNEGGGSFGVHGGSGDGGVWWLWW